jgi:uncharacterized protein YndB with AHSA1/START domain
MTKLAPAEAYGTLSQPLTLTFQRMLPGPIERVWAYLTESELRRQWLASGDMDLQPGAPFEFTWRNDELTDPPGKRPAGSSAEHSLQCQIVEVDAPRKLVITWGRSDGVTFELEKKGDKVLLTLTHRRLPDQDMLRKVGAGWHAHLDVLAARLAGAGKGTEPFWDKWQHLHGEYAERLSP